MNGQNDRQTERQTDHTNFTFMWGLLKLAPTKEYLEHMSGLVDTGDIFPSSGKTEANRIATYIFYQNNNVVNIRILPLITPDGFQLCMDHNRQQTTT